MQVTIAGRRSSAAGRGRLLHRECWPQGMRRLEAIGGRSGLGKPMPNRSPTTRCNNTTTAASTLPGRGSRARAAARHHADCPVSPLTQLCPLSSSPSSIVKGLYLGQVCSQVSAVVCLWLKLVGHRKRRSHALNDTFGFPAFGPHTSSHRESTARAFIHPSSHHLEHHGVLVASPSGGLDDISGELSGLSRGPL